MAIGGGSSGGTRSPARLWRAVLARPLLLIFLYLACAAALIVAQTWRYGEKVKQATVREAASTYAGAVTSFRNFYGNEIVPRARRAGVEVTPDYHDKEAALPLPATMSIELGDRLAGPGQSLLRLYSEYPFPSRAGRTL